MSYHAITIVILLMAIMALLLINHSLRRKSKIGSQRHRNSAMQNGSPAGAREMKEVMVELDRLAKQIHSRLDAQFAKMEAVSREADKRIDQLSRLVRAVDGTPTVDLVIDDQDATAAQPTPTTAELRDDVAAAKKPADGEDATRQTICRLADSGLTPQCISEQTGQPIGEIELILSLRRVKAGMSATATPTTV